MGSTINITWTSVSTDFPEFDIVLFTTAENLGSTTLAVDVQTSAGSDSIQLSPNLLAPAGYTLQFLDSNKNILASSPFTLADPGEKTITGASSASASTPASESASANLSSTSASALSTSGASSLSSTSPSSPLFLPSGSSGSSTAHLISGSAAASAPSQTSTEPPPIKASSHPPVGAIVGGVLGGLVVILLSILAWWFMRRRMNRAAMIEQFELGDEKSGFLTARGSPTGHLGSSTSVTTADQTTPSNPDPNPNAKSPPVVLRGQPPAAASSSAPPTSNTGEHSPSREELAEEVLRLRDQVTALSPPEYHEMR
ncbi:hypothetical protein FB45DRAFT_936876 [Roridomyces roridus]|uniref:Yeast cell wall synthesis Kre9/Knh1-like N-terminal domain-containing protein n=1 Tax=Roridomyces roridus TaxID=1738132 RepID=A0AAD7FDU1_9AGAR|nr:hypothetical protein FB45DRAFT_936876 [Roridomyces roridus]